MCVYNTLQDLKKVKQNETLCILRHRRKKQAFIKASVYAAAIGISSDAKLSMPGNIWPVCLNYKSSLMISKSVHFFPPANMFVTILICVTWEGKKHPIYPAVFCLDVTYIFITHFHIPFHSTGKDPTKDSKDLSLGFTRFKKLKNLSVRFSDWNMSI